MGCSAFYFQSTFCAEVTFCAKPLMYWFVEEDSTLAGGDGGDAVVEAGVVGAKVIMSWAPVLLILE